jgi:hypothetical protein
MTPVGIACWIMGILSAISFAFNLYPQYRLAKRTHKTGLAYGFFVLAYVGNIGAAIFVLYTNLQTGDFQWPLYGNYGVATYFTTRLLIMRIRFGK